MIPKRKTQEENTDAWLMSYADMITLLLCFFVIFVSVSEPKQDKISEIAEGMVGKFGAVNHSTPFKDAVHDLLAVVEKNELYRDVAVSKTPTGVEMELASGRFFNQGSAEFNETYKPKLDELIATLKQSELAAYDVVLESHTDDMPSGNGLYPTNWELSSARAAKLARLFVEDGFPAAKIRATGYGEARPRVPNRDKQGNAIAHNQAKNQRTVVRLERVE